MNIKMLLLLFLITCSCKSYSQDFDCNTKQKTTISKKIDSLEKVISLLRQDSINKKATYRLLYYQRKGQIQHSPHGKWEPLLCVQQYQLRKGKPLTNIRRYVRSIFGEETTLTTKSYGKYLVITMNDWYEGGQTSWRGVNSFFYVKE